MLSNPSDLDNRSSQNNGSRANSERPLVPNPSQPAPTAQERSSSFTPPTISLPKGGGAIKGIGEKFTANPVTGTGSMTVPIATSPGRSGFGPQLSLSYDSGAGNGPFGFGWNLSLPAITRKTEKGLPQYNDAEESDVFLLSGSEDLVPEFEKDADGEWIFKDGKHVVYDKPRTVDGVTYVVRRYRPRIEGLFARIERWTNLTDSSDVHWRSISPDNVLTLYGKNLNSRIADPNDLGRIFSWLICETRDDKGNGVIYEYKSEDGTGVNLAQAHERNRGDHNDPRRTVNRYLKHIHYGNRTPLLDGAGHRPPFLTAAQLQNASWMFEVVFDYGEHDANAPKPNDGGSWIYRDDPFSSYRPRFEVRTTRLCQRVLMFHHFDGEPGVGNDCPVRSTDFTFSHEQDPASARNIIYAFLRAVTQTGYKRDNSGYEKRSLPPVEFEYSQPIIQDLVEEVDSTSLENLPIGLDGGTYQWTDLHGEGIPGILTEQADAWYYKRNLSPINSTPQNGTSHTQATFAPVEVVAVKPNLALAGGQGQIMDLAGDGRPDLVKLDGPMPGFYEHDGQEDWEPFRPFTARLNRDMRDPNLKFIDLDGDGHADVLITEDNAFVWHPSLAEEGFGPALRVHQALDEEKGPQLVFADGTQSIYLADLSGDGLTDLVRIRNGEICYWPNLGFGRFGAKVTMDRAPHFDHPDQFDQTRIRLADIDGSGTTDIIYLHRDGVRLYFNQSGNIWSEPQVLRVFPRVDDLVTIMPVDLLGNGTACLVWSAPMPSDSGRQMRYVNLMGSQKPHLLIKTGNNLGTETQVQYAPSTKFYLEDKRDGKPWVTKLPFPVHVVEKVMTFDHISRNRFVTRYAYHHGYFDGEEREFRGFGMVEQFDTEEFAALSSSSLAPTGGEGQGEGEVPQNLDAASHVPPVRTKTWFYTGVYLEREHISNFFAGLVDDNYFGEYYREPGLNDDEARALLLEDTILPDSLTVEEEREACRALKGSMLRQEVYALDGTEKEPHPYTVTEQNFTIRTLQPRVGNRHAIFFTHPREVINYQYERKHGDPRIQHTLTLEVDEFANVLKEAAVGYGRRMDAPDEGLLTEDREKQRLIHTTSTEAIFTNSIIDGEDIYRTPLPAETRTYELRQPKQEKSSDGLTKLYAFDDMVAHVNQSRDGSHDVDYVDLQFDKAKQAEANDPTESKNYFRRLIEHVRIVYRPDDLGASQDNALTLLPVGTIESLALPGESYKLAFTPSLLDQVYVREGQKLLPNNPSDILMVDGPAGISADRGGYVDLDANGHWWVPTGRVFLSPNSNDTPMLELAYARQHFFLPHRYRDPFHTNVGRTESFVSYDAYDLLMVETQDSIANRITVGERNVNGELTRQGNDYRVLQPWRVMDPNRNRTQVVFDILGMVVGTAVMAKPEENLGDSLDEFIADLTEAQILDHLSDPLNDPHALLSRATTRLVHDLFAYYRTKDQADPQPMVLYTLVRETHHADLLAGEPTKIQHSFSYSDGFGREVQKKIQAEHGPVPKRDAEGKIIVGPDGQSEMTPHTVSPRWVGTGWTVLNNKGKPVRQFEPFFTDRHHYEFEVKIGVSPILFYDPVERVVATLHPNHTYEKIAFDPWKQTTYDVNDTVVASGTQTGDPRTDLDITGYVAKYFATLPNGGQVWQTWYAQRISSHLGAAEKQAAEKASMHADTPTTVYLDTLGRSFVTIAHNKYERSGAVVEEKNPIRINVDLEGNQREVRDAIVQSNDKLGRIVMKYDYDMLGNRIRQSSMEAGERWMLNDVAGNSIRAWDSRGHQFKNEYDQLRRLLRHFVKGTDARFSDPRTFNRDLLFEKVEYGESLTNDAALNLRTRVFKQYDSAGVVVHMGHNDSIGQDEAYDFKGNLLRSSRELGPGYKDIIDWATIQPQAEIFTSSTRYDALNRPAAVTSPDMSVYHPTFNEANLLEKVEVKLQSAVESTSFVTNIDYDAKGQRQRIDYGNGTSTFYEYDSFTFRLMHMVTRRNAGTFPEDCPKPQDAGWPGCQVQSLHYTYDPVGSITHIRDDAQQTIYFKNKRVEPSAEYTYDAVYRLIEATGREHLGQIGGVPIPHSHNDSQRVGLASGNASGRFSPHDGNAMGTYMERYLYDAVGNFLEMQHRGSDPTHPGWTRKYSYKEKSLIENGTEGTRLKTSNRLTSTALGNNNPSTEDYVSDTHGNMTSMPHLGDMRWDFEDQLGQVNLSGGGTAYYVYDAEGQRVRKIIEAQNGALQKDRIYLGGFELYREHTGTHAGLLRETLHITDDQQRMALVETRNDVNDGTPKQLIRFQYGNHLGSVSLELDDQAKIISYEEYTPYGSTSFQAVRSQTETAKRFRYTGKERDEETGFNYHGARYYAPWLGRWLSSDKRFSSEDSNLFIYVSNNAVRFIDPTGFEKEEANKNEAKWWQYALGIPLAGIGFIFGGLTGGIDVANAPGPGSRTFPRISTGKRAARIGALLLGGGVAGHIAGKGGGLILQGAAFGGTTETANRGIEDISEGHFSGLDEYALAGVKGAFIGGATAGLFKLAGVGTKAAGSIISRAVQRLKVGKPVTIHTEGIAAQVEFLTEAVQGINKKQARAILEEAFKRKSSAVFGGSRVRGDYKPSSDLDVGFGSLTERQAQRVIKQLNKSRDLKDLKLETFEIVPGKESATVTRIKSPEEFFQRAGTRAGGDLRAGESFSPSGSITASPDGSIHLLPPGVKL